MHRLSILHQLLILFVMVHFVSNYDYRSGLHKTSYHPSYDPSPVSGYRPTSQIIGGRYAEPGQFPFMAALLDSERKSLMCGGIIITDYYILTAAHCKGNVKIGFVMVGSNTLVEGMVYDVDEFYAHKGFEFETADHDVGLVRVKKRIYFNKFTQPIRYFYIHDVPPDRRLVTIGWGHISDAGKKTNKLKYAWVPVMDRERCRKVYYEPLLNDNHLCVKVNYDRANTGDSGGPLMYYDSKGVASLVGVTSYGRENGMTVVAVVYARVSVYIPWMKQTMKLHSF